MKSKSIKVTLVSWTILFIFSCVTINIYFPEATVKRTADEIVEEVRKSEEEEEKKDLSSKENRVSNMFSSQLSSFSFIPSAYAQQETKVSTPAIRALKESLKERFPKLRPFFNRGNIGERNDGFVQIRNERGLTLKEKALLRRLVKEENIDRKNLYAEVARALDIDPSQIHRIQKIFAHTWIRKALPGWWIQNDEDEWIRKPIKH
ncbi:MAG: DUF1318 domain-containing protein [Candidatus Aminicenantia bacterium]